MVFLLVVAVVAVEGPGIQRGPAAPQWSGTERVMKPEMGMWLATPAGNNGLYGCSAFFPICFFFFKCVSKSCVFWKTNQTKGNKALKT